MIPSLLFIFLAFSIIFPSAVYLWSNVVLQSIVFILLVISIAPTTDKVKPNKACFITGTFLIYTLFSAISFFTAYYRNASWHGWFILLIGFTIYWLCTKQSLSKPIFNRYTALEFIGVGLILLGIIEAGLGIYQYVYGFNYTIRIITQNPDLVASQSYQGILHALQTHRIIGSFGNPNVYALFLAMTLPVSIYYFFKESKLIYRILLLISSSIILTALAFTYSRGGIICVVVGLIALIPIFRKQIKIQLFLGIFGLILLTAILIFVCSQVPKSEMKSEKLETFSNRLTTPTSTVSERLHYWSIAKQMIFDHPIFGTGIGSYGIRYGRYKPVGIGESKYVHNLFLQIWVEQGLLGLLSFLGILVVLIFSTINRYRHLASNPELAFSIAIFGGIIAFIIDGFFGYGYYIPELYYLFCFLLGIFVVTGIRKPESEISTPAPISEPESEPEPEPVKTTPTISSLISRSIIVIILAIVWYFAIYSPYLGLLYFNAAFAQLNARQLIPAAAGYKAAIVCEPSNSEYHQHLGNTLLQLNQVEQGIRQLQIAVGLNPYTAYYRSDLAEAYLLVGRFTEAERECLAAIANYPNKPGYHYQLAQIYALQDKKELATQEMLKFAELSK